MAKQSSSRRQHLEIPTKTDIDITDIFADSKNTGFPGSDFLDHPFKMNNSGPFQGTSEKNWESASKDLQVPVNLPSRQSLAVKLVDSSLVFSLEEYRKDGSLFTAFFWALVGVILSILYDMSAIDHTTISQQQIVVTILIVLMTIVFGAFSLKYSLKAEKKLKEIKAKEIYQ